MAASKWRINRIGLIDFWYYDEEEYSFVNGRLLLRGANGSGKSVTMQSFIPLLLDGNKAPDRLDPFGTKARKIENYLLEENDGREERTGYLYMEFKREESDTYFTVGLGLRARRGKKLDTWYFAITDGRRIGRDFFLYKDMGNKVTLSRVELRNRLDQGGVVLDSQREYMKFVNDRLFGYETTEEYKELIDLLIQLRTPKLSKDFKPTVLNEILSNSLQPLSEDDLRPMSEAIENMDMLKGRLEELRVSEKAAGRVAAAYEKYSRSVLCEKAKYYMDCRDRFSGAEQERKELAQEEQESEKERGLTEAREAELREELAALTQKKQALDQNDATKIREKQVEAEERLARCEEQLRGKNESLEAKQEKRKSLDWKLKEEREKRQEEKDAIADALLEMDDEVADIVFDEQAFLKSELMERMDEPYSFGAVKEQTRRLYGTVQEGLALFAQAENESRECERLMQEKDAEEKKDAEMTREAEQLSVQEIGIKSELVEGLYSWAGACLELKPENTVLREMAVKIEGYGASSEYQEIREPARLARNKRFDELQRLKISAEAERERRAEALAEKERELAEWMEKEEPEPERSEAVKRSRQALAAAGIPFQPFYMTMDFQSDLTAEAADRLEGALAEMGVLDALVIPGNYESRVMAMDSELCDRYLFPNPDRVGENLGGLLRIDAEVQDLVLYQELANLLCSMGSVKGGHTFVDEQGRYGIGVLRGTTGGGHKARFIGARARKLFREETIARLGAERAELVREAASAAEEVLRLAEALELLEREYDAFPSGADLQEIIRMEETLRARQEMQRQKLTELQGRIDVRSDALRRLRVEISGVCQKARLAADEKVFRSAAEALQEYERMVFHLENIHGRYLAGLSSLAGLESRVEDLDSDLDEIWGDIGSLERQCRGLSAEIENYARQLALSNYEEIRAELDFCIRRLGEIPGQIEAAVRTLAALEQQGRARAERISELAARLERLERIMLGAETGFLAEYELDRPREDEEGGEKKEETPAIIARRVYRALSPECLRGRGEELEALQQQFYRNLSELTEYGLFMKDMFAEQDEEREEEERRRFPFRRQVIRGRYQGRQVEFTVLLANLREDVAVQENLVRDSDRELFEDILSNTIGKKIRSKIYKSEDWVDTMNALMGDMNTSSGLVLSLRWKEKRADQEEQLNTRELVELLKKDVELMREEEFSKLSLHFQSKVEQARRLTAETGNEKSFHAIMKEVLDYRQWFEFQLYYKKAGEDRRELTNNAFFTLSGGEKAMAMYVPLFSAVVAKYQSAGADAPRLISLDEAFAGVDELNIRDMFRLMVELDFQFIINSQVLWGDYDTVPGLAIYQLLRPENAKFVTVIPYVWNGSKREAVERVGD